MYREHFGLKLSPFQLTPDAQFLYLSPQHAKARAHMDYAVMNRDSCVVVSGDIGCGKTTLINRFLRDIDDDVLVARIFQTQVNATQFLQTLLAEFGIAAFDKDKAELLSLVNRFLLEQNRFGRQVVLIVDEAQNLTTRVLEEVRLLTDIETEDSKAINVILCGQPELKQTLAQPGMAQFVQRVHFSVHVGPLDMAETGEYILHRLRVAGLEEGGALIPSSVVPGIFRYTGGVPRLINTLCDTVLTAAYVEDLPAVDERQVATAIEELGWSPYSEGRPGANAWGQRTAKAPSPSVVVLRDKKVLSRIPLGERRMVIGRDADNDIPVASDVISRHHAQISYYRGAYWLMDLKSTNGTFVNGQRVRRTRLRDRDVIALGHHRLVFRDPVGAEAGRSADTTTEFSDFRGTAVLDPSLVASLSIASADHNDDAGSGDDGQAPDEARARG